MFLSRFAPCLELRSAWIFVPALLSEVWLQYQCRHLSWIFRFSTTLLKSRGALSVDSILPSVPRWIPWCQCESFSSGFGGCWGCLLVPGVFHRTTEHSAEHFSQARFVRACYVLEEMMHHLGLRGLIKAGSREVYMKVTGNILLLHKCICEIYILTLWWIRNEEWEYTEYSQGNCQSHS